MKILCYIHSLEGGGAERVLSTLANFWANVGHDVCVVTLKDCAADFYRLDPRVVRVSLNRPLGLGRSRTGLVATLIRIVRLRRMLLERKPDVALSMMDTANVVLAFAGIGLSQTMRIGSERTYPPAGPTPFRWRALRRLAYGLLRGVVAATQDSSDWLHRNTWVRQTWVIPNPVSLPLERGEPAPDPQANRMRPKRVLAVGRLVPEKGFDLLVEAFGLIANSCPDWEVAIVGDGPERARLQSKIRASALDERVRLIGAAGNVGEWYASANLFVLPSRFEGFPNTLLEAMAHGLPAVAADCLAGPRVLVRDGIDGLLVVSEDVNALGAALKRLMTNEDLRMTLATRAADARERFSVPRIMSMWSEIMGHKGA
jgi:glycosyltransferase involved in cell wall biosynthesis